MQAGEASYHQKSFAAVEEKLAGYMDLEVRDNLEWNPLSSMESSPRLTFPPWKLNHMTSVWWTMAPFDVISVRAG